MQAPPIDSKPVRSPAAAYSKRSFRYGAQAIPAPPFKEEARAAYFHERLAGTGLTDVRIDAEGNVIGLRRGSGGPTLVLSTHIDSVFPEGTDLTITEKDGLLIALGIRDDSRGLAAVLSVARAFAATALKTAGDIWFVGTVGEEGLGNCAARGRSFATIPRSTASSRSTAATWGAW